MRSAASLRAAHGRVDGHGIVSGLSGWQRDGRIGWRPIRVTAHRIASAANLTADALYTHPEPSSQDLSWLNIQWRTSIPEAPRRRSFLTCLGRARSHSSLDREPAELLLQARLDSRDVPHQLQAGKSGLFDMIAYF